MLWPNITFSHITWRLYLSLLVKLGNSLSVELLPHAHPQGSINNNDPPDTYKHRISVANNNHYVSVTQKHLHVKLWGWIMWHGHSCGWKEVEQWQIHMVNLIARTGAGLCHLLFTWLIKSPESSIHVDSLLCKVWRAGQWLICNIYKLCEFN